jgi:hypothetical protein
MAGYPGSFTPFLNSLYAIRFLSEILKCMKRIRHGMNININSKDIQNL